MLENKYCPCPPLSNNHPEQLIAATFTAPPAADRAARGQTRQAKCYQPTHPSNAARPTPVVAVQAATHQRWPRTYHGANESASAPRPMPGRRQCGALEIRTRHTPAVRNAEITGSGPSMPALGGAHIIGPKRPHRHRGAPPGQTTPESAHGPSNLLALFHDDTPPSCLLRGGTMTDRNAPRYRHPPSPLGMLLICPPAHVEAVAGFFCLDSRQKKVRHLFQRTFCFCST